MPTSGKAKGPYWVGWTQNGEASWYGPGFTFNQTANQERFFRGLVNWKFDWDTSLALAMKSPFGIAFPAAHKKLPFDTICLVKRLDAQGKGRWIRVRINDRGPYKYGRILDLSWLAAKVLGTVQAGVVPIELRILELPDKA